MSYKSTLQEHNTLLQHAIDKANDLPNAGSGGGGAVETCTLKLVGDYVESIHVHSPASISQVIYPTLNDAGSVIWETIDKEGDFFETLVEIENVVVGQFVVVGYNTAEMPAVITENAEFLVDDFSALSCCVIRCTKANGTAVVTIVDGGGYKPCLTNPNYKATTWTSRAS